MDELTGDFVAETREMLDHIGEALVAWEAEPGDAAHLAEVFRFVHTVKGSCGFLELPRIEALAHAAETVLADARDGSRTPDRPLVGVLLAIIDRIALLVAALETPNAPLPDAASDLSLIAALDRPEQLQAATTPIARQAGSTVRIAVPLLEGMMGQVSELVLGRNELARKLQRFADRDVSAVFDRLGTIVGELRDSVTRARMQPIERLFATLPRLVRDTASECGKQVRLEVSGHGVEIDREMAESIRDPLIHIVRNAIDHGIETPEARARAGKPAVGTLRVVALQAGNQVSIEITDDGRGIDTDKLVRRALAANRLDQARAEALDPVQAAALVFEAGLSTADAVTTTSGRGVGMDVVRANVERLGGRVLLVNRPGCGLTVTLRAPLTLSIVNALLVAVGGQVFALPQGSIEEVLSVRQDHVRLETLGGGLVAVVRGIVHPAFSLGTLIGVDAGSPELLVMVTTANGRFALGVEAVYDHEELVVRPTAPQLAALGAFAGQSLGHDGKPVLVLDAAGLVSSCGLERSDDELDVSATVVPVVRRPSVLIATSLDGRTIALRTPCIQRLMDTVVADWVEIGAERYLVLDGEHVRATAAGKLPEAGAVATLLLGDGNRRFAMPIAVVHDLVEETRVTPTAELGTLGLMRVAETTAILLDIDAILGDVEIGAAPRRRVA